MSKRDYYEILGVPKTAERPANQERLSQAGAGTSSGSQSREQRRRGEVQRGRRGLRDSVGQREAREVRPLRPRGRVVAGGRRVRSLHVRGFRRYFRRHLRRFLRRRTRAAVPSAAAICATTSRSRSRSRPKASRPAIQIPRLETCDTCTRLGRRAGQQPDDVSAMPGTRAAALSAGILHRRAHLLAAAREPGKIIAKPCATCKGEGRTTKERTLTVKIPGGHRRRPAPAHQRRR